MSSQMHATFEETTIKWIHHKRLTEESRVDSAPNLLSPNTLSPLLARRSKQSPLRLRSKTNDDAILKHKRTPSSIHGHLIRTSETQHGTFECNTSTSANERSQRWSLVTHTGSRDDIDCVIDRKQRNMSKDKKQRMPTKWNSIGSSCYGSTGHLIGSKAGKSIDCRNLYCSFNGNIDHDQFDGKHKEMIGGWFESKSSDRKKSQSSGNIEDLVESFDLCSITINSRDSVFSGNSVVLPPINSK